MVSFKPNFSLSSFTFIKRLFHSSLSSIRVVSSASPLGESLLSSTSESEVLKKHEATGLYGGIPDGKNHDNRRTIKGDLLVERKEMFSVVLGAKNGR